MYDQNRPMSGRDWLIVITRVIGVWSLYSGATQASMFVESKVSEWLSPQGAQNATASVWNISGLYNYPVFSPMMTGSATQSLTQLALGLTFIFGAPLLARVCYGPEPEPLPPSLREKLPAA